jgi:DivIVA domain-containing protein
VPQFDRALRGYSVSEVDAHVRQVTPAPAGDVVDRPPEPVAPRFTMVLRGYNRREVDRYVAEAQARIVELELVARRLGGPSDAG